MALQEIYDQATWDAFVASKPWASFQQSWNWGEFQKTQGHEVRRFLFESMAAQIIYYRRRLSGYWFCPRGPVGELTRESFQLFLTEIAKTLRPKPLFYRFEPQMEIKPAEGLMSLPLRRNHAMSPACTTVIDLTKSEEELQMAMHPKTRYNIRVAQKHEVKMVERDDFDTFAKLLAETAERRDWVPHAQSYLQAMYDFLSPLKMARLRFAEYKGRSIAANLEIAFGDTVTYLHGGSSSTSRETKAPQLLQWEAMRTAKQQGYQVYDLWGCNPEAKSSYYYKPSWEGITRFKRDFGGRQVDLIGTWDLPVNKLLYHLIFWRQLRKR